MLIFTKCIKLFYYKRNDNLNNNLYKSYDISGNKNDFYKDYMNLISTTIPKAKNKVLN